ncbi:MAG TPA: HU family DNA-binding protein [Pyrinomonadaceae bacterium]|jgi:integration host factor subunit beta|nr:HU family DNA-binding protein [Pyrinomonadaceae bacterium]
MTKAELVEDVARAAELTKKDAEKLVEIVFESIIATLNQGEKIELRGFGSFRVRERGARRGRNPKTGDPVDIPAKRVPYFKPGKELKELINEDSPASDTNAPNASISAIPPNAPSPPLAAPPATDDTAERPASSFGGGDSGASNSPDTASAGGGGGFGVTESSGGSNADEASPAPEGQNTPQS